MADIRRLTLKKAPEYPLWLLTGNRPNFSFPIDIGPQLKPGGKWDYFNFEQNTERSDWGFRKSKSVNIDGLTLGADILSFGNEAYLLVNNAERFKSVLEEGRFIGSYNGERIYKLNFQGNKTIPARSIAEQKGVFFKQVAKFEVLKLAGNLLDILGLAVEAAEVTEKKDAKSAFGFSMELLLVAGGLAAGGVAAPIIAGGVVLIGISELLTGEDGKDNLFEFATDKLSDVFLAIEKANELDESQKQYIQNQKAITKGIPNFEQDMSQKQREVTARELRFPHKK